MLDYQMRVLHGDCTECSALADVMTRGTTQARYRETYAGDGGYHMAARFPIIPPVDMPCSPKPCSYEFIDQMLTSRRAQRDLVGITSTDIVDVVYL